MKRRIPLAFAFLALLGAALLLVAPLAQGSPVEQLDPTDQEGTINALVQERFNQTAQAQAPMQTATAEANATLAFQQTLDAVFAQALTATAGAQAQAQATATPTVEEGGVRIIFSAEGDPSDDVLEDATRIIERRLEGLGVPADVEFDDEDEEISVRTPAANHEQVIESILQVGLLEFVDFSGLNNQLGEFAGQKIVTTEGEQRREEADVERDEDAVENPLTDDPFETVVTGDDIEDAVASPSAGGSGRWQVQFQFNERGGERMAEFSREHIGEPLAIVLDGEVLSIPIIQAEFGTGGGLISDIATQEEAERLALSLNFGSLPVVLRVEGIRETDDYPTAVAQAAEGPTATPTPAASPTFDPRPTVTTGEVLVAEEVFEHGRMFWVQPTQQIWVMITEGDGGGRWAVYEDTFQEGEPEFDPSIVPPEGMYQPERGFGKLWRENEEVRDALGWGITPEFGYTSNYEYHPGGEVVNNQYTPGPGYHVLFTLYGEAIRFNEGDGTWQFLDNDEGD